jgi:serine/threonine-protein kinase
MTPVLAVRSLLPIADALLTAHAQGMVHRDLKPANIFLAESDGGTQPKLLDFGIVKMRRPPQRPESITNEGTVVGSLAYLSPEQARGLADIDERADIWGLCAVLYECITGEVPFRATTYDKLLHSIVSEDPVPIQAHGVNDEKLWSILQRGLAKSRDERWASMRELGQALAAWLNERGVRDDICGVSLESRWLRSTGEAVKLERTPGGIESATLPSRSLRDETAASFSSKRAARVSRLVNRHWITLGGVAICVALLGFGVDRLIEAQRETPSPQREPSARETLVAAAPPVIPVPVVETPRPVVVPSMATAPSAAPSSEKSEPSRAIRAKAPAPLKSPAPSRAPSSSTDLLDPY